MKDFQLLIDNKIKEKETNFSFGEVFTDEKTITNMLNLLEDSFWQNKNLKILDPCCWIGNFPKVIIDKLMKWLEKEIPNEEERFNYIFDNILYTAEIQEESSKIYFDIFWEHNYNHFIGDFLDNDFNDSMKEVWWIDQFDLVITNPPYQKGNNSRDAISIYHLFVEKALKISKKVIMITPQKWYNNPSMEDFRSKMINDFWLKILVDIKWHIFKTIDLKWGVSYFLLEKWYKGDCLYNDNKVVFKHNLILSEEDNQFLSKIDYTNNFSDWLKGEQYFKITNNDKRLKKEKDDNSILCYVSQKNWWIRYINKKEIDTTKETFNQYKVLIPTASWTKKEVGILGNILIAKPGEVCSRTYCHFWFNTLQEAESFISYLKTDIAKKLIKLKKHTHLVKKDTFSLLVKVPLDRKWNNNALKDFLSI